MFQYLPPRGTALVAHHIDTPPPKPEGCLRLVCLSDTHLQEEKFAVPGGDVLIHSGDILMESSKEDSDHADFYFRKFCAWLRGQPHERILVVCGNHDAKLLDMGRKYVEDQLPRNATYLENDTTMISGVKFFGSPHSVGGSTNYAWQKRHATGLWDNMQDGNYDVVISHGPAYCKGKARYSEQPEWTDKLKERNVSVHICGHLHWAFGLTHIMQEDKNLTSCLCVSSMDGSYLPTNQSVVVDLPVSRPARTHNAVTVKTRKVLLIVTNSNSDYSSIIRCLTKSLRPLFEVFTVDGPKNAATAIDIFHSKRVRVAALIGFGAPVVSLLPGLKEDGTLVVLLSRHYCKSSATRVEAHSHGVHLVCCKDDAESDITAFCSLAYDLADRDGPVDLSVRCAHNVTLWHPQVRQVAHPVLAPGVTV